MVVLMEPKEGAVVALFMLGHIRISASFKRNSVLNQATTA